MPCTAHRLQAHVGKGWCAKQCATATGKFSHACRELHTMIKKTRWCCFTVTISLQRATTAHWTSWIKCWVHSRSSACRALVQQLVVRVSFFVRRYGGTNLDSRIDQIPDTCTRWSILCRWKMRDLLQHHSHVTQHSVRVELD